ncbi:MAG TPA: glycosyltransferase family 9 protein [Phaeodactylibacter sp.]|nr:glycosyltransferase family 9 protein [Phaeodactylibacter sp.]
MKKILLFRYSSIGDIVLTSPVIRCLRKAYPQANIHYLCKTNFAPILQANPYIDKVYHFEKDIVPLLAILKQESYDLLIDLHKNLRSFQLRKALGIPTYRFYKANIEKWLMVQFKINRLPKKHIVDRYMETLQPLGISYDGEGLDYFIPKGERFPPPPLKLNQRPPFLTFAIGATHTTKRLPDDMVTAICEALPYQIILLGGKNEQATGEKVASKFPAKVLNCCGSLNLHQSADAIRQSALLITHDTGMMHIGAALRKRIISIWGNTIPAFGMYPFYPDGIESNTTIEVQGLSCRPCSKIGHSRCPKKHFRCMKDINIQDIVFTVKESMD